MSNVKNSRLVHYLIILDLLIISGVVTYYYWNVDTLDGVKNVPLYVMILAFVYILFQILKRYLYKEYNWWDWLYYIGLLAMVLPTLIATEDNLRIMNPVTDVGILFLAFPILLDARKLINTKK